MARCYLRLAADGAELPSPRPAPGTPSAAERRRGRVEPCRACPKFLARASALLPFNQGSAGDRDASPMRGAGWGGQIVSLILVAARCAGLGVRSPRQQCDETPCRRPRGLAASRAEWSHLIRCPAPTRPTSADGARIGSQWHSGPSMSCQRQPGELGSDSLAAAGVSRSHTRCRLALPRHALHNNCC